MVRALERFNQMDPAAQRRMYKPLVQVKEHFGVQGGSIRASRQYRVILHPDGSSWELLGLESRGGRLYSTE